jgi:hypothetical protein
MRLRLGDDTFVYVDRPAKVLVECPTRLQICREYAVTEQGEHDDPRKAAYGPKRKGVRSEEEKDDADPAGR